eukprot:822842-Rhodomonas_salina.3
MPEGNEHIGVYTNYRVCADTRTCAGFQVKLPPRRPRLQRCHLPAGHSQAPLHRGTVPQVYVAAILVPSHHPSPSLRCALPSSIPSSTIASCPPIPQCRVLLGSFLLARADGHAACRTASRSRCRSTTSRTSCSARSSSTT